MNYNAWAFYVAETSTENRLEALPKPSVGILSGTNAPVIKANDRKYSGAFLHSTSYKLSFA
jgi:hypothetical protein